MSEGRNGANWSSQETRCLIGLWSNDGVKGKLETVRRKEAYEEVARGMREEGYERSVRQVTKKISDLRYAYRKKKDDNSRSGRGRSTWEFFDLLDSFLGDRHATSPAHLVETVPEDEDEEGDEEDEEDEEDDEIDVEREPTPPPDEGDSLASDTSGEPSSKETSSSKDTSSGQDTSSNTNNSVEEEEKKKKEEEKKKEERKKKEDERKRKLKGVRTTEKKKKTRLEAAMTELGKTMTTLQDGNKKEETEAEKMRAEHELKMLKMQQEHELKMMGQFMTVMTSFFGNTQRYSAPTANFQVPETSRPVFNAQPPQFTNTLHFPTSSTSRGTPPPLHYPTPLYNNNNSMYQGHYSQLQQPSTPLNHPNISQGPRTSTPIPSTQGPRTSTIPSTQGPRTSTPIPSTLSSSEQQWPESNLEDDTPTYFSL